MIKRAVDPFDQLFIDTVQMCQLAIHVKHPSLVDPLLEKVKKIFVSTKTRLEGNFIVRDDSIDVPIIKLPENFKNMSEACNYMFINHSPLINQTMGTIGANSDTIVINSNHVCTDGGYCLEAFNALRDDLDFEQPKINRGTYASFENQINEATCSPPPRPLNPRLTRIHPKDQKMAIDFPLINGVRSKVAANKLTCFDKEKQKPIGMSDFLYTNIILAGLAFENKFDEGMGITTVMSVRPYLPRPATFEDGCAISLIPVSGKGTLDTTIAEFMKSTREDFNERIKRGEHFGFIKDFTKPCDMSKEIPGLPLTVTNIGQFKLGGPIDDVGIAATVAVNPRGAPFYTYLHYSVIGEGRNDTINEVLYSPTVTSKREAQLLLDSVLYGFQNIQLTDSLGVALDKMKGFQEKFIRNEYPKYLYK